MRGTVQTPAKGAEQRAPLYRWVVYGLLALCYFLANFHRLATGVMQEELTAVFGLTAASFGNLGSMVFYAYMVMQVPTGILVDTIGPRMTVTAGCLLTAAGSMMFSMANTLPLAYASRFLIGIGISVSYLSTLKVQAKWFRAEEFATITGLTFFIGNMGSLLAQTPLRLLVEKFTWRGTFAFFAVLSVVMAALVFVFVRNAPEEKGYPPLAAPAAPTGTEKNEQKQGLLQNLAGVLANRANWPPFLICAALCVTVTTLTGSFGTAYIRDVYELTTVEASGYTAWMTVGIAVGAAGIGFLSDLTKRRKVYMVVFSGMAAVIWAYVVFLRGAQPPLAAMKALYFLSGVSLAAYTLPYTVVKKSNDAAHSGLSTSLVGLLGFLGSSLGPVAVGKILDRHSAALSGAPLYAKAFALLAVCNIVGFVCALLIRETGGKNLFEQAE